MFQEAIMLSPITCKLIISPKYKKEEKWIFAFFHASPHRSHATIHPSLSPDPRTGRLLQYTWYRHTHLGGTTHHMQAYEIQWSGEKTLYINEGEGGGAHARRKVRTVITQPRRSSILPFFSTMGEPQSALLLRKQLAGNFSLPPRHLMVYIWPWEGYFGAVWAVSFRQTMVYGGKEKQSMCCFLCRWWLVNVLFPPGEVTEA